MLKITILVAHFCLVVLAKTPVYILGLYPLTGSWPAGETILAASRMAIDHVNNDPRILQEYELVLIAKDSSCNGGRSVNAMYEELYNISTVKIMIAGAGCSLATEPTAEASHFWNLVQISFSANSPELSFRELYPRFFRLCLSEYMFNPMRLAFFQHFGWKKVATIYQRIDFFSLRLDGRIIWGNFYEPQARQALCAAWKNGLFGPKYVWIIPSWFQSHWWRKSDRNINCTVEQMDEVTKGYFGVYQILFLNNDDRVTFSGKTSSEYVDELRQRIGEDVESQHGFQEAAYGYDTIWAMALALNQTDEDLKSLDQPRSIAEFNYNDDEIGNLLLEKVTNTKFQGLTGTVQFLDTGDRRGIVKLTQNQNGTEKLVGLYDHAASEGNPFIIVNKTQILWMGDSPPFDSTQILEEPQTVSTSLFALITIMSTCGAFLAVSLFVFNIVYRSNRFIKLSSPRINNLMLSGGILMYVSMIFMGVDLTLVSEENFVVMWKVFLWSFTIGFSIFFGSMFSKTWRVHRIFASKSVVSKKIKDPFLLGQVAVIVCSDVFVFVLWELIDPMGLKMERKNAEMMPDGEDMLIVYIYTRCTSQWAMYWMVALYAKHALLLMFGAFLAWETRKVHMVVLNDSKQIGTSLYVVMVSFAVGLPVSIFLQSPNGSFGILALLIFSATTFTICMVFIPKVKMRNDVYPQGKPFDTGTTNREFSGQTFNGNNEETRQSTGHTSITGKGSTEGQRSSTLTANR